MGLIRFLRDYFHLAEQVAAERSRGGAPAAPEGEAEAPPTPASSGPPSAARSRPPSTRGPRVRVATLDEGSLRVLDLRVLEAVRTRIRGSSYVVKDAERAEFGGTEYLLVREPENRADPQAVAVYGRGRRVGYLSATKAAAIAPLMDAHSAHDAFLIGGATSLDGGTRLWIDLPRLPALRAALRA